MCDARLPDEATAKSQEILEKVKDKTETEYHGKKMDRRTEQLSNFKPFPSSSASVKANQQNLSLLDCFF